ncbi:MAG: hypothetical protein ACUZ77_05975 [Candidatus Brocadiales bacterium]
MTEERKLLTTGWILAFILTAFITFTIGLGIGLTVILPIPYDYNWLHIALNKGGGLAGAGTIIFLDALKYALFSTGISTLILSIIFAIKKSGQRD